MSNRGGIPIYVENIVKQRDRNCVYCGIVFSEVHESRKSKPSWEHIINDIRLNGIDNIALCCISCNASKGAKFLKDWLHSDYCKKNKITTATVAEVVQEAFRNLPKLKKL
jgi:hypothetical protein